MRKPAEAPREAAMPAPVRPWYLASVLGGILSMFLLYYAGLFVLKATGNLPPPAFSNSICTDEKLAFLRHRRPRAPTLLVIGSSVAWRHFDGDTLVHDAPWTVPLNGAFCGLTASQSAFAANWLLDHHPTLHDVLLIITPHDFSDCTTRAAAFFDRDQVDRYVYVGAPPWWFYTRYFDLRSLVRNAADIAGKRSGADPVDPLVFDRYGSGPLRAVAGRGPLLYGAVTGADPACFAALSGLAARLHREQRRLLVATTPLHPEWRARHDPQGTVLAAFSQRIRSVLQAEGGTYWDSNGDLAVAPELFFDAIHLRWAGVPGFTAALTAAFHLNSPSMASAAPDGFVPAALAVRLH